MYLCIDASLDAIIFSKRLFSCNHPSTCDGKNDIKRQRPLSDATTEKTTSKDNVCFRMPARMHLHAISHSYVDAQLKLDCLKDMFSCNHPCPPATEKTTSKDNVRSRMLRRKKRHQKTTSAFGCQHACISMQSHEHDMHIDTHLMQNIFSKRLFSCNHPSTCDGKNDIKRQRPLSDATTEKTTSKDNVRSRMPHIFFMHDILHIEIMHALKASL